MIANDALASPGALLESRVGDRLRADPDLWGFGGLHGGLSLALLTSAMRDLVPGTELRSVTGQFARPIRGEAEVRTNLVHRGRTVALATATAGAIGSVQLSASAVFGRASDAGWKVVAQAAPAAPEPSACEVFTIPVEFVPFARHTEIRPVDGARPFAGGSVPELTAWIRLVADDEPPDVLRLITVMDALAPSYAAVMDAPTLIPTVELTVRPAQALTRASSPWILVRARTRGAGSGGWIDEDIDAWGPDGTHLGSAHQLRVVAAG